MSETERVPGLPAPWELREIAYRASPVPPAKRPASKKPPKTAWPRVCLLLETVRVDGLAGPARLGAYLQVEFIFKTQSQNSSPKLKSFQVGFKCTPIPG